MISATKAGFPELARCLIARAASHRAGWQFFDPVTASFVAPRDVTRWGDGRFNQ